MGIELISAVRYDLAGSSVHPSCPDYLYQGGIDSAIDTVRGGGGRTSPKKPQVRIQILGCGICGCLCCMVESWEEGGERICGRPRFLKAAYRLQLAVDQWRVPEPGADWLESSDVIQCPSEARKVNDQRAYWRYKQSNP